MDKKYAAQEAITHSMMGSLGLKLIEEKEGFIRASMPVNDNTSQPFGVLCGGASLAFAEIIAGYGSYSVSYTHLYGRPSDRSQI